MDNKLLYLSQADVKSVGLTMAEIIQATEKGFVEMGNGQVEMPPKPVSIPEKVAITSSTPCPPLSRP